MESNIKPVINFDKNWNGKLLCNVFTTIRPRNDDKYKIGSIYDIALKNVISGPAELIFIKHLKFAQITEAMALVDTGYSLAEATGIFEYLYKSLDFTTQEFTYMILKRTTQDVELSNQIKEITGIQATDVPI